jgi:hypothetical protein
MPRNFLFCLLVVVVVGFTQSLRADDENTNVLKLEDGATLTAPEGFVWKKSGEEKRGDKKTFMYLATKEGVASRLFVAVEPETADTQTKRSDRITGFYQGILKGLPKLGLTDVKATPPDTKPPIPRRVELTLAGKTPDGTIVVRGILIFGRNTYYIQAAGQTEAEAAALGKSTESLKE